MTKIKFPRLTAKQKINVHKWLSLLEYCFDYCSQNESTKGYVLMLKIESRLIRDYGFNQQHFWEQIDNPKFSSAYNSSIREYSKPWGKYLERLEARI